MERDSPRPTPWSSAGHKNADWDGANLGWVKRRTQYRKYASWQTSSEPNSGKGHQTCSGISMRHSCQKTLQLRHCRKWTAGKMDSAIKLLIKRKTNKQRTTTANGRVSYRSPKTSQGGASLSSKVRPPPTKTVEPVRSQPPDFQRRWKRWHVPSAGLPQGVTVGPQTPSSSQIQWACYKKWHAKWEAQTCMYQCSTYTFGNSCECTALDMPEWSEIKEQIDWRVKATMIMGRTSEDLKCWEAWDTTCGQKATDITPSVKCAFKHRPKMFLWLF